MDFGCNQWSFITIKRYNNQPIFLWCSKCLLNGAQSDEHDVCTEADQWGDAQTQGMQHALHWWLRPRMGPCLEKNCVSLISPRREEFAATWKASPSCVSQLNIGVQSWPSPEWRLAACWLTGVNSPTWIPTLHKSKEMPTKHGFELRVDYCRKNII